MKRITVYADSDFPASPQDIGTLNYEYVRGKDHFVFEKKGLKGSAGRAVGRVLGLMGIVLLMPGCRTSRIEVVNMQCEYQTSPIGIDTQSPRFSWNYAGDSTWQQGAFRLILADSPKGLKGKGKGFRWESALTPSAQMTTAYIGREQLKPHTTYYWRIEAAGADGKKQAVSPTATFETAKMSRADWTAHWITDGRERTEHTAPLLRRTFEVKGQLSKARLYVSAAAYAKLELNGQRLSTTSLNPGYTHYDRRNLYCTYDATSALHQGRNVLTAVLGNGFYNEIDRLGVWDFDNAAWHGRPRLLCELRLTYTDGRVETVASDESWQAAESPFLVNDIYSGDTYDARCELAGIEKPEYDDTKWKGAVSVDGSSDRLVAQQMPATEVDTIYRPVSLRSIGDSIYVIDFGQNMSGYARLTLQGQAGTQIRIQHGEELDAEGRLNVDRITGLFDKGKGFGFQTDVYTLSGRKDVLRPEFTYHGFRYIEVHTRPRMKIREEDAEALFVHTAMKPTGWFSCSNDTLNMIWKAVRQSYLSNFMSIPTDCPQREKNGWTADAHISQEIGLLNFDSFTSYEKWLEDMADNQRPDGQIADIIPSSGWGYGVNPVWSAVLFIVPMSLYLYSGDLRPIERALPLCRAYLKFLAGHETERGSIAGGLGDWVPYKTSTPEEFTSTCYYYYICHLTARFCELLGQDGTEYDKKAERIKQLLNSEFVNSETGLYSNGSQAAQGTALYLGIVPQDRQQALAERLSEMIAQGGNHLDFGMLGSKTVLRMLTKYGHIDQALDMALMQDAPSWAAWIAQGHTTPPEEWIPKGGSSLNHVFLGDINAWMMQCLAGINYDPLQPGFQHVIIEPCFPRRLEWAEGRYQSRAGLIVSRWERREGQIVLTVEIPANATATVRMGGAEKQVGAGRHTFRFN